MSHVTDEVHAITVALSKSENMRVTAAVRFAELWRFVSSEGTAGAQQVIDAGHEPTQYGLWQMIIAHPSYPNKLGSSFSTAKRLLSIGNAPDPEKADAEERRARAQADRARREVRAEASFTQQLRAGLKCNKGVELARVPHDRECEIRSSSTFNHVMDQRPS